MAEDMTGWPLGKRMFYMGCKYLSEFLPQHYRYPKGIVAYWDTMEEKYKQAHDKAAHEFAAHIQRELSLTPNEAMQALMGMADPAPMKDQYTTAEIKALDDKVVKIVDGDDKLAGLNEDEQAALYKFLHARGWTLEKAKLKWSRRRKD